MVLSRTRSYVDGEILSKANNSINTQIIKALLCYYAVSGDFPIVDSLSIVRKKSGQLDYTYTECDNILQPIQLVRSLDESTVAKIKGKVVDGMRDAVGDNMLRKIHALVK